MPSRSGTLTVLYRSAIDTSDKSKALTVDVTDPYESGYFSHSESTKSTYIVPFNVVFSDNKNYSRTEQVNVECKAIYNAGVSAAIRYIYASNDGAVNFRKTSTSTTLYGSVYPNTLMYDLGETANGRTKLYYNGYTGWVVTSYVHTTAKSGTTIRKTSWYHEPSTTPEGYTVTSVTVNTVVHYKGNHNGSMNINLKPIGSSSMGLYTSQSYESQPYQAFASSYDSASIGNYFQVVSPAISSTYRAIHNDGVDEDKVYHKMLVTAKLSNGSTVQKRIEFYSYPVE